MALRVGFVGLGTMGVGMARNLGKAGFALSLASRTASKARTLAKELGARACESPQEVAAASDVVVSCLPDAPEVEEVHLGPNGTIRGASRGAILIDCSTIDPDAARSIAERVAASGCAFLDAPVSGGQKGALEGTLTFFVGGDTAALEKARSVFAAMGKRITHLGPSGSGQLGKAVNQIVVAGTLIDVLGKKMMDRDFKPAFAIKHQQKDLAIVLRAAREKGVPLPGTALVHQLLSALEAQGRGEGGTQALLTLYERMIAPA
jgi:3-hydroxyisobutyrate dehydrogenase-like beta-hydroxyacid dehydrogenase